MCYVFLSITVNSVRLPVAANRQRRSDIQVCDLAAEEGRNRPSSAGCGLEMGVSGRVKLRAVTALPGPFTIKPITA